ncbi:MAG: acetyl-CoA carboxylase biotin carboxyl carrier protein subunit [Bacteroidota bacterium]
MEKDPIRRVSLLENDYLATANGNEYRVNILRPGLARIGDVESRFDLKVMGAGSYSLIMDSKVFEISIGRTAKSIDSYDDQSGEMMLSVNGRIVPVVVDDRLSLLRKSLLKSDGQSVKHQTIRAPMPGLVVRVEVGEHDQIIAGEGLIVLEAMKMENEIRASAAGKVEKIFVAPGLAVEKGEPLLSITYH